MLNPEQQAAVSAIEGPVMVLAGPGTGKTEILASRIEEILRRTQLDPYNILCLTFTESGAVAMRARLKQKIGPAAYSVQIQTFHSFCNGVIQENPEAFSETKELESLTELERVQILREILVARPPRHLDDDLRQRIVKPRGLTPDGNAVSSVRQKRFQQRAPIDDQGPPFEEERIAPLIDLGGKFQPHGRLPLKRNALRDAQ